MTSPAKSTWETAFRDKGLVWGHEPTRSAVLAAEHFERLGLANVLVPGVGYGRNAKPFLARGMKVTGIEISETAIALARSELALDFPIHHGSVVDMPFDDRRYDGIFCYGLLYLLDPAARAKVVRDCHAQLAPGGCMMFTVISTRAPMYGQGPKLGDDWYEVYPGLTMFFYDAGSVEREFAAFGLTDTCEIDEPVPNGGTFPFINVICRA